MPTIAGQITRIQNARNLLRTTGVEKFHLNVPAGTYWDDATNAYVTTTAAAALSSTDQLDKIAAAFNSVVTKDSEVIKVPMKVVTDGTTTTAEAFTLPTGFYAGATIVPYITVSQVQDVVLNIQAITDQSLTTQTGTITPSDGFNYLSSVKYTITSGAVSTANAGYSNTSVTAKIATSGWVNKDATTSISVPTSTLTSKVGTNNAAAISSGATIAPSASANTVITIGKGIYSTDRTLTISSVTSQIDTTAVVEDILEGKTAWIDGSVKTGTMPNKGGISDTARVSTLSTVYKNIGDKLAIVPVLGYYNSYSDITTNIAYNPTRTFSDKTNSATTTDTMTAQTYYETIPAGYYSTEIKRKIQARSGVGSVKINYTNHTATFDVTTAGWFGSDLSVGITAGAAVYKQKADPDLKSTTHTFTVVPAENSYLTKVTIDNTAIFDLLAAI